MVNLLLIGQQLQLSCVIIAEAQGWRITKLDWGWEKIASEVAYWQDWQVGAISFTHSWSDKRIFKI